MSLPHQNLSPVPAETARIASLVFPHGNIYLQMRDALGSLYADDLFAPLYSVEGQPALHPWQLALVSVMQFAENLSDRQAADAVRARIDWKYALGRELTDQGFHYSVLSEFRARLIQGGLETLLLDRLLACCQERGWLRSRGEQRIDSTHIVGAVKVLNHLELVGETLRHALNVLATVAPEWLHAQAPPEWFGRYGERIEDSRLPKDKIEREALSAQIGEDGYTLQELLTRDPTLEGMQHLPAIQVFIDIWTQQYRREHGHAIRLTPTDMPPVGEWLRSPYDPDVRYGKKREFEWLGYKVHLTECCDEERPHLITQVTTAPAIEQDHHALETIQADLASKGLLPAQHLVDAGYISATRILHSRDVHAIDLIGPVHIDPSWPARTSGALDVSCFQIDWEHHCVTCPQGQQNQAWYLGRDAKGESVAQIFFPKEACQACPVRERCTTARTTGRSMTIRFPQERHEMLQLARQRQHTDTFKAVYRKRAGVEGTFSQVTRNSGLRRSRSIGLDKTHLQHLFAAVAINIVRLVNWLNGTPFAKTRISRFAALAAWFLVRQQYPTRDKPTSWSTRWDQTSHSPGGSYREYPRSVLRCGRLLAAVRGRLGAHTADQ